MKFFTLSLLSITLLTTTSCIFLPEERTYCGKVVTKFHTDAAYKVQSKPHVVFFSDSLKRNIDVQVTWNTYVNMYENRYVCFKLTERDLEH